MPWDDLPDATNHLVRIFVVSAALNQEWYPRWLSDLYLGYGYPLLNFYAPGLYYLGAGLHKLGLSIFQSLQVAGLIGITAGAGGALALAWALFGRRDAALLAAGAYLLAPYPFFTNLYVRGDVPEALALGVLPWLLRAAWGAWWGDRRWCAALAGLTAVLVLTHNVTALFGLTLLAAWLLTLALLSPQSSVLRVRFTTGTGGGPAPGRGTSPRATAAGWNGVPSSRLSPLWGSLARVLVAAAVGLGLSAFFWLPSLAEMGQVRMSLVQADIFDFHRWLFSPLVVEGGTASTAYPHTRLGPADLGLRFSYDALNLHVPEKISLPQILLWLLGTVAAIWGTAWTSWDEGRTTKDERRKAALRPSSSVLRPRRQHANLAVSPSRLTLAWSALAGACLFLNTTWSAWLWEHLPLLAGVQFPWRLYGPLALCVSLATAGGLACLPADSRLARIGQGVALGLVALMAINAAIALRPFRTAPPPAHDVNVETMLAEEYDKFAAGTTSGGEFLPKTVDWPKYRTGVWPGIRLYEQAYDEAGWQAGLVRVVEGQAAVTDVVRTPGTLEAVVDAATPTRVAFHQLLFAGWQASVDTRPAPIKPATYSWTAPDPPHEHLDATLGFMVVDVPAGQHRVAVRFAPTPPRLAGTAISVAALAMALAWVIWRAGRAWAARRASREVARERGLRNAPPKPGIAAAGGLLLAVAVTGCAVASVQLRLRSTTLGPAGTHRIVLDVANSVRAGAASATPTGPGRGLAPPFLDLRYLGIGGEQRRWLYMHPPSSATVTLRVPPHAYFQAGLGLDPQTWDTPVGDGVRFVVEARAGASPMTLLDRRVNPRARGEDRQWLDEWISLEAFAGQTIELTLRTDAVEEPSYDWAGWANPQVVIWDGIRPNPGIPHKY
jgi:hypothetical protein